MHGIHAHPAQDGHAESVQEDDLNRLSKATKSRQLMDDGVQGIEPAQCHEKTNEGNKDEKIPQPVSLSVFTSEKNKEQRHYPHITACLPKMPGIRTPPIGLINDVTKDIRDQEGKQLHGM